MLAVRARRPGFGHQHPRQKQTEHGGTCLQRQCWRAETSGSQELGVSQSGSIAMQTDRHTPHHNCLRFHHCSTETWIPFIFRTYYFYFMCKGILLARMPVCHMSVLWRPEEDIWYQILLLELQTAVSHGAGSGKEPRSFGRTAKTVNC